MKYSAKQYAIAFLEAAKEKKRGEENLIKNFLEIILKNNDWSLLPQILKEVEKEYLKREGLKKVVLESTTLIAEKVVNRIEEIFGNKVLIKQKINPSLLAGIRILINDQIVIDATGRKQIEKIFSS